MDIFWNHTIYFAYLVNSRSKLYIQLQLEIRGRREDEKEVERLSQYKNCP